MPVRHISLMGRSPAAAISRSRTVLG
jgi:hypothetical protein